MSVGPNEHLLPFTTFSAEEVKINQSHYMPVVPRGFQEFKVPALRDNSPGWL